MAWYYHSGNVVRPVEVRPGVTVAVRPHSKVEVLHMTGATQVMIKKGMLRRTGKPKGSKPVEVPKEELKMEDVLGKSPLAQKIAEKGSTVAKSIPPKPKKGGTVELTIGEQEGAKKGNVDTVEPLSNEDASADVENEKKKGAAKKRRK